MKKLFAIILFISLLIGYTGRAQNDFFSEADNFFKKYVADGKVVYKLVKENADALNKLQEQIAGFPLTDEIGNRNKAFYINAYNLLVIKQVVDNYPVNSPVDVPGFFESTQFNVAGDRKTLNQIENNILRPVYQDARMHFVLVCGALGCPPITDFAYLPDNLDIQLDRQTKLALNNEEFIRIENGTVKLSEIFKWYKDDFEMDHENILEFINSYRDIKIPTGSNIEHYPYDWTLNDNTVEIIEEANRGYPEVSNIFAFTPSKLLKKGQTEMQLFNNLYTQTAYRDENREKVELETRDTYYSGLFYLLYGVSKSSRINIGFDLNLKSVYQDSTKGSPFKVFKFKTTPYSRTALTSIGPKIKFQPLRNVTNFSVQSAFWFPIAKDLESIEELSDYPWMDYHMYTWWNQFFYDKTFGSNWQIFTEADLLFRFKAKNSNTPTHLDIPLSFFLSWFPINKLTVYYMIQYSPRFQLEKTESYNNEGQLDYVTDPFDLISDYAHTGAGLKYQITKNLNLEGSYTYFFTSKNGGAGSTYNFGIRIIL